MADKRSNPWQDIFKRKSVAETNEAQKRSKRDQTDPHVCLSCGTKLDRGSNFYKERHWLQMHLKEPKANSHKLIVRKDHVKAREILKLQLNETATTTDTPLDAEREEDAASVPLPEREICEASDLYSSESNLETMASLEIPPLSPLEVPLQSETSDALTDVREDHVSVPSSSTASAASGAIVQSTLESFRITSSSEDTKEDNFGKLQKDISSILIKLEELKLSNAQGKKYSECEESLDIAGIKAAKNLLELSGEKTVKITFLDDGCCISCIPCNEYIKASPFMKISSTNKTWGQGNKYGESKTESLVSGKNQEWYGLKSNLIEHMSCSSMRSGGQFHAAALQHMLKEKQKKTKHMSVTVNIVSAAIEVCKMKAAAVQFESMLSFLSYCQTDIGNIGHSRYAVIYNFCQT
eukprot:gene18378-20229_t